MEELKELVANAATKDDFEDMEGRLTNRKNTIFKCKNCKFVDCKNGRDIEMLSEGMKVHSKYALECYDYNGKKISIPENAVGVVVVHALSTITQFRIIWILLGGVKVPFNYDLEEDPGKVAYKCK